MSFWILTSAHAFCLQSVASWDSLDHAHNTVYALDLEQHTPVCSTLCRWMVCVAVTRGHMHFVSMDDACRGDPRSYTLCVDGWCVSRWPAVTCTLCRWMVCVAVTRGHMHFVPMDGVYPGDPRSHALCVNGWCVSRWPAVTCTSIGALNYNALSRPFKLTAWCNIIFVALMEWLLLILKITLLKLKKRSN